MSREELEKEATEWVRQKFPMLDLKQSDMSKIHEYEAYIAGAEFGYNKAFVEADKNLKAVVADFNKANEWHILSEEPDVLPKEGQKVKVLTEDNVIQESTYFYDDYFEGMAFSNVGLVKVLAWKEIKEND